MNTRTIGRLGAALAGLVVTTVSFGAAAHAAGAGTIHVPSDFDPAFSDTRATGHYEVLGTGLHVWTEGATSTDKVAEYVDTATPLADAGEPSLELHDRPPARIPPGFQLVVDFDNDGRPTASWSASPPTTATTGGPATAPPQFVKDGAPAHVGGFGSANHGTLDQWRAAFPNATVLAFGFSLGSGVLGDGVINSIDFAGTRYTFTKDVALKGKDDCKKDGWTTSTMPVFKNQGDCVSHFASGK